MLLIDELKTRVLRYADQYADPSGLVATPIDGVEIMRRFAPSGEMHAMYRPLLCLVLQGAKELTVNGTLRSFGEGQSLVVSIDMPVVGRIVGARADRPYLAVSFDLDMGTIRDIATAMTDAPAPAPPDDALFVADTDAAIADCVLRLVRLLDRPEAIPILRPPISREMHYWLLAGRHGAAIRRLALPDGRIQRIARAIAILRADFSRPIPVDRLAAAAGMSQSSFHQHFKAATSLSPLQFQKQLRLLEARQRMLNDGIDATRAAFAVGYESVSQFSREYARMFGQPPRRDLAERHAVA